jgi:hypothetical protein
MSASVVVRRGGYIRRAARWLWVAVQAVWLDVADSPLLPADVVVGRLRNGEELTRIEKATVYQAEQLLSDVNKDLKELTVDEFRARWGIARTD